jgi:DNA-binding NtrC family response regulator
VASILVAATDTSMRSLMTRILRRAGHRVTEAHDWEETLLVLEREPFDLVLLDVSAPEGEEVALAAGRLQPSARIVCVGTAPNGPSPAEVTVIQHPLTPQSLLDGVRRALDPAG